MGGGDAKVHAGSGSTSAGDAEHFDWTSAVPAIPSNDAEVAEKKSRSTAATSASTRDGWFTGLSSSIVGGALSRGGSRSSRFSRLSSTVREFKFKDKRWMWLPISSSVCLGSLCGFLFYCQGLEPKTNAKIFADPDAASASIWSPEIITPCWDSWDAESCWGQYLASSFFGFCALVCIFHAWISYNKYFAFESAKNSVRRQATKKSAQGDDSATFSDFAPAFITTNASEFWQWLLKFSPGNEYFWHRAWLSLLSEIVLQSIRGFILDDSYARVSATQTLAQIILMVVHVNLFSFFYAFQSEVGYVFVGLYSEIAYLAVRVSLFGPMALRHTSFLDFLTLALPIAISMLEVQEIQHFIYHHSDKTNLLLQLSEEDLRTRGHRMGLLSFAAMSVGLAVGTLVVYKGFFIGCPDVYNSKLGENRPEDFLLPFAVDCFVYQFNFFINPSCSCIYLVLHPYMSENCAGMGSNQHEIIEHVKPNFADVRYLLVGLTLTENCRLTDKDLELFASWTNLRGLSFEEFTSTQFPSSFKDLKDLSHIIVQHGWLEHVDELLSMHWPKLEMFSCQMCPHLDNLDFLTDVLFQRLMYVEIHGAGLCPSDWQMETDLESLLSVTNSVDADNYRDENYHLQQHLQCSPRRDTEVCEGLPDWLLISLIEGLKEGANQNICSEVLCSDYLGTFNQNDFNRNYLYDAGEFRHYIKIRYRSVNIPEENEYRYTEETHKCFVNIMRQIFRFHYNENYQGIADIDSFVTIPEYLAFRTRYSTCTDCPEILETFSERKKIYDESMNVDESDICAGVMSHGRQPEDFQATCAMDISLIECHQGMCPLAMDQSILFDANADQKFTSAEVTQVGISTGQQAVYNDKFIPCLQERVPACIDTDVDGEPAMSLHTYLRIGFHIWNVGNCPTCAEKIDCSKC